MPIHESQRGPLDTEEREMLAASLVCFSDLWKVLAANYSQHPKAAHREVDALGSAELCLEWADLIRNCEEISIR